MSPNTSSDLEQPTSSGRGSARKREALELFRGLPRHYDLLSAALSFGQDPRWRRALVSAVAPASGERVLDVLQVADDECDTHLKDEFARLHGRSQRPRRFHQAASHSLAAFRPILSVSGWSSRSWRRAIHAVFRMSGIVAPGSGSPFRSGDTSC